MIRFFITVIIFLPLLGACAEKEPEEGDIIGREEIRFVLPQGGKAVHPKFGKETWFAFGAMDGVGDTPANGVVQGYGIWRTNIMSLVGVQQAVVEREVKRQILQFLFFTLSRQVLLPRHLFIEVIFR